jgi:hypothetical protein
MLWRKLQVQSSIPSRLITALMHTLGDRVLLTSCIALYITTIALNICVLGTYTRPVPRAVRAWCLLLVLLLLWQAFLTRSCCAGKESQSLAAVRTDEVIRIGRFDGTRLSLSSLPAIILPSQSLPYPSGRRIPRRCQRRRGMVSDCSPSWALTLGPDGRARTKLASSHARSARRFSDAD